MKLSMPIQIVIAVLLGALLGFVLPGDQLSFLSEIGKIFIHWVKLIAGPFLFCTIIISIIQVDIKWSHGIKVIGIALLNTSMALSLAIILSQVFLQKSSLTELLNNPSSMNQAFVQTPEVSLNAVGFAKTFMPSSLFAPFVNNDILLIALLALVFGIAIRSTKEIGLESRQKLVSGFEKLQGAVAVVLHWVIKIIPFAVFAIISATVSKYGFGVFLGLSKFVGVVVFGFILQIGLVYGTWIFLIAKYSLKTFVDAAKVPVLYALGVNSSLATLPLTLEALKKLKVSDRSASLGAGIATNLNNDGIVLYEAMAVIFISYSYGMPMDIGQFITIALTCIVASVGITGIPEAGFISLSVIVGVLGLPIEALPLLLSVDWILARLRSAVNVLSDMTLSIAMDATETN
jgi:Na+/H+-dicarboxylate symporter